MQASSPRRLRLSAAQARLTGAFAGAYEAQPPRLHRNQERLMTKDRTDRRILRLTCHRDELLPRSPCRKNLAAGPRGSTCSSCSSCSSCSLCSPCSSCSLQGARTDVEPGPGQLELEKVSQSVELSPAMGSDLPLLPSSSMVDDRGDAEVLRDALGGRVQRRQGLLLSARAQFFPHAGVRALGELRT